MYADITIHGYKFINREFEEEMEKYLASLPFVQRQGVKGMLDFFKLHSKDSVIKFIKRHFNIKPTKNLVVNAIIQAQQSDEFKSLLLERDAYVRSKNFFPKGEIDKMCRLKEYISSDVLVDRYFFKIGKIKCEEDLALEISKELFNRPDLEIEDNFINTAFKVLEEKYVLRIRK